mmetsp:Transcript_57618/g.166816  ORF Transcript_57618/g.166816 Transcript_57618/m.166816 type:complete len:822 (-) Transcript_57618:234-2699(-)
MTATPLATVAGFGRTTSAEAFALCCVSGRGAALQALSARGLPEWLLACLSAGLPAECALEAVTDAELELAGIHHPLHRRRLLRELGALRSTCTGHGQEQPEHRLQQPGVESLDYQARQDEAVEKASEHSEEAQEFKHREAAEEEGEREEDTEDAECEPVQLRQPLQHQQHPLCDILPPPRPALCDAERRHTRGDRASCRMRPRPWRHGWKHGEVSARVDTGRREVKRRLFIPLDAGAQLHFLASEDEGVQHSKSSEQRLAPVAEEEADSAAPIFDVPDQTFLDWDAWMETRLHPLKAIDGVVNAAFAGSMEDLQEYKALVEEQGEEFVLSLEKTPCPRGAKELWRLAHDSDDLDGSTSPPRWLWEWVCGRLTDLHDADRELRPLLKSAEDTLQKVVQAQKEHLKKQTSLLHARSRSPSTQLLVETLDNMNPGSPAPDFDTMYDAVCSPSSNQSLKAGGHGSLASSYPRAPPSGARRMSPNWKLATKRLSVMSAVSVISNITPGGSTGSTEVQRHSLAAKLRRLFLGTMQERLVSVATDLEEATARLDKRLGSYRSEARSSAVDVLAKLQAAEAALFSSFLNAERKTELNLRDATSVHPDTGVVALERLAAAIEEVMWLPGAQSLVGAEALVAAKVEKLGGTAPESQVSKDPWAGRCIRTFPPWRDSFVSALKVFSMERRRQSDLRRSRGLENEIKSLRLKIISATGFRNTDGPGGSSDPYCICELAGQPHTKCKTQVIPNSTHPVWECMLELERVTMRDIVNFSLWDYDGGASEQHDDPLGRTHLTAVQALYGFDGDLLLQHAGQGAEAYIRVSTEAFQPQ